LNFLLSNRKQGDPKVNAEIYLVGVACSPSTKALLD
jgi:hypothetical protein